MKYKFEEINIGDEIYFNSTPSQSNHDLYWKVISKIEHSKHLVLQLDEMGHHNERWLITVEEIRQLLPTGKKK